MNRYLTKIAGTFGLEPATLATAAGLGTAYIGSNILRDRMKHKAEEKKQGYETSKTVMNNIGATSRTLMARLSPEDAAKKLKEMYASPKQLN